MPSFFIDEKEIEFKAGEDILTATLRSGLYIPHYCYHEALSRVATCRMCMVEVTDMGNGRPMPKLATSCSTAAAPGMKITVQSPKVVEARKAVMEFLLVNHPLDCPICDQSGECDLQDFSFEYGTGLSIVSHEKRVYGTRQIGSFLELERNRCIHCTRCVRFTQEITGTAEMGTFGRGHQLTVDTFIDQPLSDPFQGNLADICPVGAITLSDFRFKKRAWKLTKTPTICDGCASGCNVDVYSADNQIYRLKPRTNEKINRQWMCDYGRLTFHPYQNDRTILARLAGKEVAADEAKNALIHWFQKAFTAEEPILLLDSGHSTLEEINAFQKLLQTYFPTAQYLYPEMDYGTFPEEKADNKFFMHHFISPAKAPNGKGLEKLGSQKINQKDFLALAKGKKVVYLGIFDEKWFGAQDAVQISPVFLSEAKHFCLPAFHSYEKTGTFINRAGFAQNIRSGLRPPKGVWNPEFIAALLWQKLESFTAAA